MHQKPQRYQVTQVPLKYNVKGDTNGNTQGEYLSWLRGYRWGKISNAMVTHLMLKLEPNSDTFGDICKVNIVQVLSL